MRSGFFRIAASVVVTDGQGRILVVREADPRVRAKVNLPGGHLEGGETPAECALRELREETGVDGRIEALLGVYIQSGGVNIVYEARALTEDARPGGDILRCEWLAPEETRRLPDEEILRPRKLRAILADHEAGRELPSSAVGVIDPEEWEQKDRRG